MTRKVTKKAPVKKVTKKTVAKKATTPRITMTLKQAQTIQKALGTKSYAFLNKKVAEVSRRPEAVQPTSSRQSPRQPQADRGAVL